MTHADIIARLTAATGPDRDLDRIIECSVWFDTPQHIPLAIRDKWNAKPFTASVDACLALIERVLPGAYRATTVLRQLPYTGTRFRCEILDDSANGTGAHNCEPLALLLALFRALETQEPHHG